MVVEFEVLKAQKCALSKLSLPMHSSDENFKNSQNFVISKHTFQGIEFFLEKIARRIRLCTASILVIFVLLAVPNNSSSYVMINFANEL